MPIARDPRHGCRQRALTLVETLAVLVIASLAAVILTSGLAAASGSAALRRAEAVCRWVEGIARLHTQTHGSVLMQYDPAARTIHLIAEKSNQEILVRSIPANVEILIQAVPPGLDAAIRFGPEPSCPDHTIQIRSDGTVRSLRVNGLTGLITENS